ncbi:MAG: tetratricopeptide (TPR) repeat protein [Bradymonadia bacterium]|jgi:tetratricopeptide (TPR) repeat protein
MSAYSTTMRTMTRRIVLCLCMLALPAQAAPDGAVQKIHQLISDWQTVDARARLEPLLADEPSDPTLIFLQGRLLFFEARYKEAVAALDTAIAELGDAAPSAMKAFREEVAATYEKLKGLDEYTSPDGRFFIRHHPKDALLMPYLVDVLQRADAVYQQDFRMRPQGRIVVEIYPEITYLAAVSPLTEDDIETSGTIALCKYNRLMFTSPRALVRGYGWRDTVAHEFVHYYLTKASGNSVPIWLHEGIAKFEETRWRAAPGAPLDPPQEDLLARSLKADKLVTFKEMHPSMAKLPSQEAASLAYAEVHTAIQLLYEKAGYDGLMQFIGRLKKRQSMDDALQATYGFPLSGLWTYWKRTMKTRNLRTYPGLVQTSLKFKRPGDPESDDPNAEPEADYDTIEEKQVKDLTHIGELLRARGRIKAALKEYEKAIVLGGDGNPVIQNGAAAAMIEMKAYAKVPETLTRVSRYYPSFLKTHLNLGQAYMHLKNPQKAIEAFEEAVGINPFHPLPHASLAKLYAELGETEKAARAQASLELLK